MQFAQFQLGGSVGIGVQRDDGTLVGLLDGEGGYPGTLQSLVEAGAALERVGETLTTRGRNFAPDEVTFLPPLARPDKVVCVGLNYADHASESGFQAPSYPVLFARFASSLVGHGQPLVVPRASPQLDYEGELVAVIGKAGRHIAERDALTHVVGYAIFNDASVRDYQMKTSQWTVGKNFDATGAFGPTLTLARALPPGCEGLRLETRLNGQVLQSASTIQMIFPVATLVSTISAVMRLEPGDILVTGTPSGVGFARTPPIFMKEGDVCEVSIEGLGVLRNPVRAEPAAG